jgi:hypothetical protein
VYKPRHELLTPAGIDHDYNFISSIERGIERSDKLIVEEKGLVGIKELLGDNDNGRRRPQRRSKEDTPLAKAMERAGVIVDTAPKGMKRNKDNSTNWSKYQKCINWQVEWVKDDGSRFLGKVLESQPIGEAYAGLLEEQRRANMTEEEKMQRKKRKAEELKTRQREAKKAKRNPSLGFLIKETLLQNPKSSAWNLDPSQDPDDVHQESTTATDIKNLSSLSYESYEPSSDCYFYLHRPHTASSLPRVLIPLHPLGTLSVLLPNHVVLEFPTIYALSSPPNTLPKSFMLEDDYLAAKRKAEPVRGRSGLVDYDSNDSDVEDGEIV